MRTIVCPVSVSVVDDVLIVPSDFVPSKTQLDEPPPVYVPVTDQISDCPLLMLMVVPLLIFSAVRLVCVSALMVCAPVRYWLALMVWLVVPG